jgi:hypothetical protein
MAICRPHVAFYEEIFALPGFLQDPFLIIGRQSVEEWPGRPDAYDFPSVRDLIAARGVRDVVDVDLFDPAAASRHDLNEPFPESWDGRFGTVFDSGTIEHLFDTATALRNYLFAVRPAGFCYIHVPVKGYYLHGLHTFSPEVLPSLFELNGFDVKYLKHSTPEGIVVGLDDDAPDMLQWIVARRRPGPRPPALHPVQQRMWTDCFAEARPDGAAVARG